MMVAAAGCRDDELVIPTEYEVLPIAIDASATPAVMYLLNEGNMGSNKSTIDMVDFRTAMYYRNMYAERNPTVVKELGDVGNDIQVYGSRLYAVINCSHKVEVMDATTLERIGQVDIPNCRYIRFWGGEAYVSSYVGPVEIDPTAPLGAVYRVDTATLAIKDQVTVGYQPEEMEIVDGKMYVANSGGYRVPNYDNRVSVVSLEDFTLQEQIPVAINLHHIRQDHQGKLWVTSRGDYYDEPSRMVVMEPRGGRMVVTDTLEIPCSDLAIRGDSLYFLSSAFDYNTGQTRVTYGIVNTVTKRQVSTNFITDGTEKEITAPYGIAINPTSGDIYVTDAKNYVSSGMLHCYSPQGVRRWSVRTGDVPGHFCFR